VLEVIKSFRHKGIERFFKDGDPSKIQPKHAKRLRNQLFVLNEAAKARDMDLPGWKLHPLKGDMKGHWAVWVDENWRLTFKFEGENAILVDYQDYHGK
jgi:proteic killer suppression protein